MSRLLISAAHKSSGKTSISVGICAALKQKQLSISPFKKGPDYIDPMWLSMASGQPCYNLDFFMMSHDEIRETFEQHHSNSDISLIEGNKGLYDGLDVEGSNSNAALAKLLHAPVVLVIDARGMTRGIAPLILGYQDFDKDINIAGVILNQLGGSRHESKLRTVIEHYTDVPVLGAVHHDPELTVEERHLGLIPSNESDTSSRQIKRLAHAVNTQVDVERLLQIASQAEYKGTSQTVSPRNDAHISTQQAVRIAIAKDDAFGFYYPGDMEMFKRCGAELIPFNTLKDAALPTNIDGLFIGGGFPEMKIAELAANSSLMSDISTKIKNGLPTYAECGGLMYLTREIEWQEKHYPCAGVIPADTVMHKKPQGRGYVILEETDKIDWPADHQNDDEHNIYAHEFHYSALTNLDEGIEYAYRVKRGTGIDGKNDGLLIHNLMACYTHQRALQTNNWVKRFIDFVRLIKNA